MALSGRLLAASKAVSIFPRTTRSTGVLSPREAPANNGKIDADHLFANNVRFLAMAAIIGIHTINTYVAALQLAPSSRSFSYLTQPFKFGTIGFFLIAGFLFGERIDQYDPLQYLGRRLRNVFVPWLIWFSLYYALRVVQDFLHGRAAGWSLLHEVVLFKHCMLNSAFWFVPNLLFALTLLLILRRFLYDWWVGLVLLLASLFYSANIYGHWIPVSHTRAVFGFVFYLWLGAWGAGHFPAIEKRLARIPMSAMLGLILLTLMLSFAEARLLFTLGSRDPLNTIRISNQVYSVVVVLAIMKLRHAVWPHFINVREHTFGLYLTHAIAADLLHSGLTHTLLHLASFRYAFSTNPYIAIPVMFVLIYGCCLLLVQALLSHPTLRYTIGLPVRKAHRPTVGVSRGLNTPMTVSQSGGELGAS